MKNQEIKFKKKSEKYSIFIGENSINLLPNKIKTLCPKTKKIGVIVDKNIPSKYKQRLKKKLKGYEVSFLPFLANEKNKSLTKAYSLLNALFSPMCALLKIFFCQLFLTLFSILNSELFITCFANSIFLGPGNGILGGVLPRQPFL